MIYILLNITLNTMWFNVGYWKDIDNPGGPNTGPSSGPISGPNPFIRACQAMTDLLTSSVGMVDGDLILGTREGKKVWGVVPYELE